MCDLHKDWNLGPANIIIDCKRFKHRLLHLLRYRNVLGELFYEITCNSKVASDLVTAKIRAVESVVCVNRLKKKINFKIFSAVVD